MSYTCVGSYLQQLDTLLVALLLRDLDRKSLAAEVGYGGVGLIPD